MKAHYLGHVVFYVKDLKRSLAFYRDLLGFREVGKIFNGAAAAFTSGRTHHELLLIQVGDAPGPPTGRHRGLYHIGIKVGDSLDELRAAKKEVERAGVTIDGMSDHTVSQSLYLHDPDGNEVELYVDANESLWKNDPAAVAVPDQAAPLVGETRGRTPAPSRPRSQSESVAFRHTFWMLRSRRERNIVLLMWQGFRTMRVGKRSAYGEGVRDIVLQAIRGFDSK